MQVKKPPQKKATTQWSLINEQTRLAIRLWL